ncbi:VanZ family protein [Lysinibacillus piscis]|uniref:Permease n=1 Tax=Lysinibacillus piscis TaxID=2518931 RepID=A0ABQ5NP99_9BACI|nr:VanZ family protein [Lysinibacillus sp. KH24]GLC90163.1 permease [Lysinibacillus sp. KH24]
MSTYAQPIFTALLITILASFILFIPWLIHTYRKYGYLSFSKTIIMWSFIFYFLAALCLVLLPFPETRDTCSLQKPDTVYYNVKPFQFVADVLKDSGIVLNNPTTWLYTIKQPAFFQAFFNFLLLMPFGVYLRYFFKERRYWKRAFFLSFLLTLFYEITQVTGVYGIFNCAYRIFDVDDLMLNSIGALLGFVLAPVIWAFFPSDEAIKARAAELAQKDIVKPVAIILALAIDFFIGHFIWLLISTAMGYNGIVEFVVKFILYVLIFAIVPSMTNGATLGMKIMRFTMKSENGKSIIRQSWRRCIAIVATVSLLEIITILGQIELTMDSPFYTLQIILTLVALLAAVLIRILMAVHIIRFIIGGGKRRLYIDTYADLVATREK